MPVVLVFGGVKVERNEQIKVVEVVEVEDVEVDKYEGGNF